MKSPQEKSFKHDYYTKRVRNVDRFTNLHHLIRGYGHLQTNTKFTRLASMNVVRAGTIGYLTWTYRTYPDLLSLPPNNGHIWITYMPDDLNSGPFRSHLYTQVMVTIFCSILFIQIFFCRNQIRRGLNFNISMII